MYARKRFFSTRIFFRDIIDDEVTNMNGSVSNIAGICNKERNVFGLMPHPERAIEEILGSTDGVNMLKGLLK